jgi:flavin reductase (DIM6/NTAB) family NADH-FMN oxidoreductase RutF
MNNNIGASIEPALAANSFRDAMASVCTPVTVITAFDGARPHGTTVSAFASLSAKPPMIMVALDYNSELLGLIRASGRFGVNVLGIGHHSEALRFAVKSNDKFVGIDWSAHHDVPRLTGAATWLVCDVADLLPGGDHVIVTGDVLVAETEPAPPLTYHGRIFGTHEPLRAIP